MPSHSDVTFGRIVLKNNLVPVEKLWGALSNVATAYRSGRELRLADVLVKEGALAASEAQRVHRAEALTQMFRSEKLLGKLVIERGLIPPDVVRTHHEKLRAEGFRNGGLGQMFVQEGLITQEQLSDLFGQQMMDLIQRREKMEANLKALLLDLGPEFTPSESEKVLNVFGERRNSGRMPRRPLGDVPPGADTAPMGSALLGMESGRWHMLPADEHVEIAKAGGPVAVGVEPRPEAPSSPEECPIYGYDLLSQIGKGSMGVVYKARHVSSGRTVALKILPLKLAQDAVFLERFKREAMAAVRLNHRNIVRAYDFGGSEDFYYLALEFVEGKPVDVRLEAEGRIGERESLSIVLQVARALEHAAEVGIVHRDIKPENILVTPEGVAKLSDFGIVKLTDLEEDSSLTVPGTTVGTPYYISPEQARGDQVDTRSDIYSLGITLFHMVTGELPFKGKTQGAVLLKHVTEPMPDPRRVYPSLSVATAQIIGRMTQKQARDRYQSPGEVVGALETILR